MQFNELYITCSLGYCVNWCHVTAPDLLLLYDAEDDYKNHGSDEDKAENSNSVDPRVGGATFVIEAVRDVTATVLAVVVIQRASITVFASQRLV